MTVSKTLFKIEFFDGNFVDGCITVISEIPALYFQFGSMVISITYLNSFGLMAPILIWIIHMIFWGVPKGDLAHRLAHQKRSAF